MISGVVTFFTGDWPFLNSAERGKSTFFKFDRKIMGKPTAVVCHYFFLKAKKKYFRLIKLENIQAKQIIKILLFFI